MKRFLIVIPLLAYSSMYGMKNPLCTIARSYYLTCQTPDSCLLCPQKCSTKKLCFQCPTEFVRPLVQENKQLRGEHQLLLDVFKKTAHQSRQLYPQQTWPDTPLHTNIEASTVPQTCFRSCYVALREQNDLIQNTNNALRAQLERLLFAFHAHAFPKQNKKEGSL